VSVWDVTKTVGIKIVINEFNRKICIYHTLSEVHKNCMELWSLIKTLEYLFATRNAPLSFLYSLAMLRSFIILMKRKNIFVFLKITLFHIWFSETHIYVFSFLFFNTHCFSFLQINDETFKGRPRILLWLQPTQFGHLCQNMLDYIWSSYAVVWIWFLLDSFKINVW